MRRRAAAIVSAVIAALAIVAAESCSSSYVSDSIADAANDAVPAGSEGGACYPNDTCDAGLTCASHLCVRIDGGAAGDAAAGDSASMTNDKDADSSMATIDAGSDAGSLCTPNATMKVLEYTCTDPTNAFCIDPMLPPGSCAPTCSVSQIVATCLANAPCSNGLSSCCANNLMVKPAQTCPLVIAFATTQCTGGCAAGTTLCQNDTQCPAGEKCLLAELTTMKEPLFLGLCRGPT